MLATMRGSANRAGPTNRRHRSLINATSIMVLLLLLCNLYLVPGEAQAQTALAAPTFSHQRGFYNSAFSLTLSAPAGQIYYTTNGASPVNFSTGALSTHAKTYTGPISINTTTVVRAVAISGSNKSPVVTHTYIFLAAVRNQNDATVKAAGWPDRFAADDDRGYYPADYEMDPEVLNHPNNAGKFESVMRSLPTLSIVTDLDNLWHPDYGIYYNPNAKEGHEDYPAGDPFDNPVSPGKWERPVSIEWINPDGTTGFHQNGGMRMHGQASRRPRRTPKKTFRLYFKKGYSPEVGGNLEFQLFDQPGASNKFDRLVVRMGGNRSWPYFDRDQRREADYVNDEWARRAWGDMGHLTSHGTYVHLYLNGVYWGLYNVAERIDEKFLAAYHPGLSEDDFDLIESDEDQDDNSVASAGTMDAYNELLALINPRSTTPITNDEYNIIKTKVDVISLADYFIHVHYIGKTDWPDHNYNVYRARVGPDTRFKFIAWDNDSGLNKVEQNTTLLTETETYPYIMGPDGTMVPDTTQPLMLDAPLQIFNRLLTNPEFRQVVTDRFYKHVLDPKGALAPDACRQRYIELTDIIDQAVIAESARWGDYSRDVYPPTNFIDIDDKPFPAYLHSRDLPNDYTDPTNAVDDKFQKNWLQVRAEKLSIYCPNRGNIVLSQYQANGWYEAPLNVPGISQRGGLVPPEPNNKITLNNTTNNGTGDIYYTLNGVDPRQEFGAVAPGAINGGDSVTITINRATTLKARVRNGNSWSPLLEYTFAPTQPLQNLIINEIHYNPSVPSAAQDPKRYEFIELYNKGATPLQLDGVKFSRGISFEFPANTTILPGQFLVLASDAAFFQLRYGFAPFGEFSGSLANEGEALELFDAVGNPFGRVDYKVTAPWPELTGANAGRSLSLFSPTSDNTVPGSWRASLQEHGTPGQPNGHTDQGPQTPSILWLKPAPITYGEPLTTAQLNATIIAPPDMPVQGTWTYDPPLGTVLNAGYGQTLKVTFTPTGSSASIYGPATITTQIDVLRAPLTIAAENKVKAVGAPNPLLTVLYSGLVNGDTPDSLDVPPMVSTTATTSSPVGQYPITVWGAADANYEITFVDGTLTVTDKKIPVINWADPAVITYGTALSSAQLNATARYNGQPVAGSFKYDPPAGTVLNAGSHLLKVTFTPADKNTYETVTHSVMIHVAKAPLTIRADNKRKQVGTPNPPLTATYIGFVNGDTPASLDVPPILSTTATTDSPVGQYPITVTGAMDANYAITFIEGILTVTDEPVFTNERQVMLPMLTR